MGRDGRPTRTFGGVLRRGMLVGGERSAVVCGDVRLTHRELADRTRRLGDALARQGLVPGDRVAVLAGNCHRYLELYLGLPAAGLVIVPINARHALPEIRYALQDAGVRVLFADRPVEGIDDLGVRVIAMGEEYEELLARGEPVPWPDDRDEDDLAGIFYTGGTTGSPKGVMLTHGNLIANAFAFMACWPFTRETSWLVVAPLFHAAGTIGALATVWSGGEHVVLGPFDAGRFLDLVEREAHHRDAHRAGDDAAARRRAVPRAARRVLTALAEPRLGAGGNRAAAPARRDVPGRGPHAHLRRDGDVADRDAACPANRISSTARAPCRADRVRSASRCGPSTR